MSRTFRHAGPLWRRFTSVGGLLAVLAIVTATPLVAAEEATAARTLKISVSNLGPVTSGTRVVARVKAFDEHGRAVSGVKVRFRWSHQGIVRTAVRSTGASGRTSDARRFDCGSGAYQVTLKVRATWQGQVRRATRTFWVSGGT